MTSSPTTPEIPGPTDLEIKQANEALDKVYDFTLSAVEVTRFIGLVKELRWREQNSNEFVREDATLLEFTHEIGKLFAAIKGAEPDAEELSQDATVLLMALSYEELKRVKREITALIVEHRPIPFEHVVSEKTSKLIQERYDIALSGDELAQVIQLLTRKMWVEEGLESRLETFLDNLTKYPEIAETLDLVISKLKGS